MTTYAAWLDDLTGLDVTGVTARYDAPPLSLATANLPALFPMPPSGDSGIGGYGGYGYERTLRCDLCVALRPIAQDVPDEAFADQVAMLDALESALQTLDAAADYRLGWTLAARVLTLAGTQYHGLVASVTATE